MSKTLPTVAVIGCGTMGAGIAEVAAAAGHPVLIYDIAADALTRAVDGIGQRLASRVVRGKLAAEQAEALLARIVPVTGLAALADAWLVIEAASERPEVKKALFGQLAAICSPSTLLTSNTSSLSITAIAADVKHPERVAGLHFFNPAPVMKLVEVVSGLATSPEVVEQLCQCVSAWGKRPVRCRSTPGFIVNRVARPFYAEAWRALEEQVAPPQIIDAALREGGGFPMGPLALTDLIGQDVNFAVTCSVFNAFWQDRRFLPSLLQQELALAGRLGKKSGQGVYRWPAEATAEPALAAVPEALAAKTVRRISDSVTGRPPIALDDVRVVETEGETAQALSARYGAPVVVYDYCAGDTVVLASAATNPPSATDKAVRYFQQQGRKVLLIADYPGLLVWRTVAMLINEALDALQKGVASAEDIDTAMCLGVNYPHGPLAWGQTLGWGRVLRLLENLQQHYGEERYRPCSLLRQRALVERLNEQ
ncbi:3-hydroxybutyryl-CoA dehydrogenase [Raoultella sp. BIGb0138]|uniref:3-hydroxyacyl-CoA dehydrogenase PaaH n=1 Tax=Raoultella sp. BIGb0138 TaxID=2485115 RepID=UPI001047B5AE|nr:3-hydroxyacyl-CoA dehydrogenase PaaH [Raoultella sp. BIGb0138]TCW07784.1 3-hydroxybutyryl-CoA dehydrogenase [Raoultella sp. BIGb0138]